MNDQFLDHVQRIIKNGECAEFVNKVESTMKSDAFMHHMMAQLEAMINEKGRLEKETETLKKLNLTLMKKVVDEVEERKDNMRVMVEMCVRNQIDFEHQLSCVKTFWMVKGGFGHECPF